MKRGPVIVLASGVLVVAVAVGVAVLLGRGGERPGAPADQDPAGVSSTRLPSPDPSYWTPERMRSARPAPMPEE